MKKIIVLSLIILFLVSMAWAQEKCEAPIWNVGDSWTYENSRGQTKTREVVHVSNDLFFTKYKGHQNLSAYDRKTMNLKYIIDKTGKQVTAIGHSRNLYDFPSSTSPYIPSQRSPSLNDLGRFLMVSQAGP